MAFPTGSFHASMLDTRPFNFYLSLAARSRRPRPLRRHVIRVMNFYSQNKALIR